MHMVSGLFLTGGLAESKVDLLNEKFRAYSVTGGIEKNVFGIGATTVYAEYANSDAMLAYASAFDGKVYGIGVVQAVNAAALDLFASYRKIDLNEATVPNADVVIFGARVKF